MKVAIFETEHFEGAFPVIKLFDMPGNEITIYTTDATHKRFLDLFGTEASRYMWTILSTSSKFSFFRSLYSQLKKHRPDLLYINTISDNHLLYAQVLKMLRPKRTIMTVHDINCLFESRASMNFRKAIIHRGKQRLAKRIDEFNVVSDTMLPYLHTKINGKRAYCVPGAVFENKYRLQTMAGPVRVVIPGSLDKRRRNYEEAFELLSLADQMGLPIKMTLLGGYHDDFGRSIALRAKTARYINCSIHCYDQSVVDQEEFDQRMDAAHFVFIPSVINTVICGDIPEIYGITKSSGNIFDVIKHAKPFIIPEGLMISQNLQTSCFKYKQLSDIIDFLAKLQVSPGHYQFWQENAAANSKNYTIEKVRERNSGLFRQLPEEY